MTPRGAHMCRLVSPLRAPLLLPKVVCNVHVALSNLTQHLFCIDIWFTGIWSTSVQCADSQSRVEVKRLCGCPGEWIADLVRLNLMLATIIKIYMYHGSCVMYISLCAIRSWNWNWKLTQNHFLIERWIQRTHRCSAVRCWPWGVFSSWLASRDLGTTRSSYLAWVGPVVRLSLLESRGSPGLNPQCRDVTRPWAHECRALLPPQMLCNTYVYQIIFCHRF